MKFLEFVFNDPTPFRRLLKKLIAKVGLGSFALRLRIEALERYHYAYMLYHAAQLAQRLGIKRISALEFGVAGGNGLLWMERHAEAVEQLFDIKIDVYGFDTGGGLPPPSDYRDLPYHWQEGDFRMNRDALQKRLKRAKLVFGNVEETVISFLDDPAIAPIGVVAHDMDFYSSTKAGLRLFDGDPDRFLPRLWCYFDDTIGGESELYGDSTGERLAIREFNATHDDRKLDIPYHLRVSGGLGAWRHQIWIFHLFSNQAYTSYTGNEIRQLPLQ